MYTGVQLIVQGEEADWRRDGSMQWKTQLGPRIIKMDTGRMNWKWTHCEIILCVGCVNNVGLSWWIN